ncbi:MAG: hypothetical protein NVS9B4_17170 [Candidatus Acidiferrum sp.]
MGAIPNHATKHTKNAHHERWNARIGAVVKSQSRSLVALPSESRYGPEFKVETLELFGDDKLMIYSPLSKLFGVLQTWPEELLFILLISGERSAGE